MDPASSMQIAALIVLVLLSAFFSGTETAFTSFNKTRMKTLAGDGNKKAKAVMKVEENYEKFLEAGDLSALQEAYEAVLANKDQPVRVLDPKEPFEGVALGITSTGELRVRKEDGTIAEVHSGEVSVRGLYSYV